MPLEVGARVTQRMAPPVHRQPVRQRQRPDPPYVASPRSAGHAPRRRVPQAVARRIVHVGRDPRPVGERHAQLVLREALHILQEAARRPAALHAEPVRARRHAPCAPEIHLVAVLQAFGRHGVRRFGESHHPEPLGQTAQRPLRLLVHAPSDASAGGDA